MIASVAGAIVSAMPVAMRIIRSMIPGKYAECLVDAREQQQADRDTSESPLATVSFVPMCSTTFALERRHDHRRDRPREEADAGLQRGVAEHELEVLGEHEDRAEHREEHGRDRAAARAEARVLEEPQVEHRLVGVQLPPEEERGHDRRRPRTASSVLVAVQPFVGASITA